MEGVNEYVMGGVVKLTFSFYLLHMLCICSVGFCLWENVTHDITMIFVVVTVALVVVAISFYVFVEKKLCSRLATVIRNFFERLDRCLD